MSVTLTAWHRSDDWSTDNENYFLVVTSHAGGNNVIKTSFRAQR